MDDAVRRVDIRLRHVCATDAHGRSLDTDGQLGSCHVFNFGAVLHLQDIRRQDLPREHVCEQHTLQLCLISEQCLEFVFRDLGECVVAWSEDFTDGNTSQPIEITVTVGSLPQEALRENRMGMYLRGWSKKKKVLRDEPHGDDEIVVTVRLTVDSSLEPAWELITDRQEARPLSPRLGAREKAPPPALEK